MPNRPFNSRHNTSSIGDKGLQKEPRLCILSLTWMVYVKTSHLFNCEVEMIVSLVQIMANEIMHI